jgi:aconitate decarboxylase
MLSRGWHSGVVFGTLSAAAAAGTIYGLDAAGFEDALGMAATQSCGLMSAQFESMVKRMQHGFAARNGLTAAALAAAGYTGIKRVFERRYGGYLATFGEAHDTNATAIYNDLGSTWETQRIAVKAYAAMGLLHAAIDGALKLRATGEATVDQIARINIDLSEAAYSHGGWQATRPLTTIGAQMNVAYAVAVALLDGVVLIDQFSERRINSDDVWRVINRTHTHHEKSYDSLPQSQRLTTRLVITFHDGTTRQQVVTQPRGTGSHQLTNAQIVDKYRSLTHSVIEPDRQQAIENAVLSLETLDDIAILTAMLNPPVNAALT